MKNALLDMAQGASNAAASTVSAPVDAIAWLLRKAGVNIPAPVGGSDWMAAQGLTKQPKNALAGIAGESLGMVAPMMAAAKAPQIANALLKAGDNLASTQRIPMSAQRGAIVWHGSPHKFDKFDSSKIGTGEGAQAYGHGLYLAESPDVARQYQSALSSRADTQVGGIPVDSLQISDDAKGFVQSVAAKLNRGKSIDEATGVLQHNIRLGHPNAAAMKEALEAIQSGVSRGSLYKVDLPDEAIARMLNWDAPISQQHPDTALALQALQDSAKKTMPSIAEGDPIGRGIYSAYQAHRGGDSARAAQYLRELGVPGVRYLDGGSRGAGGGTSNFVVFPGEESLLRILERNGIPLK